MDRDRLERYLAEGLSLTEIGVLENRDPSTVGYWAKKHGLEANGKAKHASRGPLDEAVLRELVDQGATLAAIAARLDRSQGAVRHWLTRYGLRTKGRRGPRPMVQREIVEEALAMGARTLSAKCPTHGEGIFVIEGSGRVKCRQCRMDRVADRRRKNKGTLAEEAGGRCVRCGYDAFVGALQFHHLDPKEKKFGLAQNGSTKGIEALREEARKCVLLCANCHAEVEHGEAELSLE